MTAGLQCFMCNVSVVYRKGNVSKIKEHLQFVHKVDNEVGYLIAGFFMTEDEREAVKDAVADKAGISVIEEENLEIVSFAPSGVNNLNKNLPQTTVKVEPKEYSILIKPSRRSANPSTIRSLLGCKDVSPMKTLVKKEYVSRVRRRLDDDPVIVGPDEVPGLGKVCRVCGKGYSNAVSMRRHFEDVHQPGEYPCKVCGKVFSSYNKVTSHYSRVCRKNLSRSGPWQHPCDRCGIVLKSEYYLIHREKCQKLTSTFKGVESLRKTQSAVEEEEDEPVANEESPIVKKSIVTNFSNIDEALNEVTSSDIEAFTENYEIEVDPLSLKTVNLYF